MSRYKRWPTQKMAYIYKTAKQRCVNPNSGAYPWYGAKGVRFLLTREQFLYLWIRDNAHALSRPSIDRINPRGHYVQSNCRFIELSANIGRCNTPEKARKAYTSMLAAKEKKISDSTPHRGDFRGKK